MKQEIINYYLNYALEIVIIGALVIIGFQLIFKAVFPSSGNLGIGKSIGNILSSLLKLIFRLIEGIISFVIDIILSVLEGIFSLILWLFRSRRRMYGSARFLNRRERRRLFSKKK